MEPDDNYAYDPIAEALGWFIRDCAGIETMLSIVVALMEGTPFAAVERMSNKGKANKLATYGDEAQVLSRRIHTVSEIRHALVHGLGARSRDRGRLRAEILDLDVPGGFKVVTVDRPRLIDLANEARAISGELQRWMRDRPHDERELEDYLDELEDSASEPLVERTDAEWLSANFAPRRPGTNYVAQYDNDGSPWGVFFDPRGKPKRAIQLSWPTKAEVERRIKRL